VIFFFFLAVPFVCFPAVLSFSLSLSLFLVLGLALTPTFFVFFLQRALPPYQSLFYIYFLPLPGSRLENLIHRPNAPRLSPATPGKTFPFFRPFPPLVVFGNPPLGCPSARYSGFPFFNFSASITSCPKERDAFLGIFSFPNGFAEPLEHPFPLFSPFDRRKACGWAFLPVSLGSHKIETSYTASFLLFSAISTVPDFFFLWSGSPSPFRPPGLLAGVLFHPS